MIYLIIILMILFVSIKALKNNTRTFENTSKRDYNRIVLNRINSMSGGEFEQFIGYILRLKGHKAEVTKISHDGGIDIIIDNSVIVECKRYGANTRIGSPIINKLVGATVINGYSKCILVTTGELTAEAREVFAKAVTNFDIKLWGIDYIMKMVNEVDHVKVLRYLKV